MTLDDINFIRQELRKLDNNITDGYLSFGNLQFVLDFVQDIHNDLPYDESLIAKAAYLFWNLIHAHAFPEGNKRIAFTSLMTFLRINGKRMNISNREAFEYTLSVYNNNYTQDEIKAWITQNILNI